MMDLISSTINLQKILNELCTFFMQIFKSDEVPNLPEFDLLYASCPDESKLKLISFLISAAIDTFASQSGKVIKLLIGDKIGIWRTLVVRLCQNHFADKHHLPFEIDIIASRNKLIVESLVFDWPFCNEDISQLLQYLCEAFHGSNIVSAPYLDDYAAKFKSKYRRAEVMKCLILSIKWVHTVQYSTNYEQTNNILKPSILNMVLVSEVMMKNREGQFDEVWNEIISQHDNYDEFDPSRIDSYPLYCQINPLLKSISDLIRVLFSEENITDFPKIINSFHEISERYESPELWGLDLTNTILAALNTIMIEMVFRKCRVFPKICENNLKMFINAVAVNEPISQMLLMSEVNYWVERLKRKRVELPINISDYFSSNWNIIGKESIFISNLEEYLTKVLQNESSSSPVPVFDGSMDLKHFQKLVIGSLKSVLGGLQTTDQYAPPINESKMRVVTEVIGKMAKYYSIEMQTHFSDKLIRVLERFNGSIGRRKETPEPPVDSKALIIPLMDNIDYKQFVTDIWRFVNLANTFLKPINVQEYLIDLRHKLFSEIDTEQADRIISRLMFYTGWRFRFRAMDVQSAEMFRFHLVFSFLSDNIDAKPLIDDNIGFWMRKLSGLDCATKSYSKTAQSSAPFQMDDLFLAPKLDSVKSHVIQVLRGAKNISIPPLGDLGFPPYKRGLETTKAILHILRSVFATLNESNRHKHDSPKNWVSHMKALEADLHVICIKLDADRNQVFGELGYLNEFIRPAVGGYDPSVNNSWQNRRYGTGDDNELVSRIRSRNLSDSLKQENIAIMDKNLNEIDTLPQFNLGSKRKLIDMEHEEPKMIKLSKNTYYDNNYDNDDDDSFDYLEKWELSRASEKANLHSKVNFINSSSEMSIGELIESRITYISEPNLKSICIDPGKGKSRPPKYIQISACPNRIPIDILKKPKLSSNRHKSKPLKNINESKTLYNFKVIREVGKGSFGKIFEAVDKFSDMQVALKRIMLSNTDDGIPQSILREIFLYKSLNHANIIQFVDIVVNEIESIKSKFSDLEVIVPKSFYFVFEYVEHDLYGLLKSKTMIFSMRQIGFLSKQLFSGLAYIHEKNIIHRDITPSNLMISNRGILKIADFGNARLLTKDVQLDNNLALTPKTVPYQYRAPEILLEMDSYGSEVDIWSAGCVIYEILTSTLLWTVDGEAPNENEAVYQHTANIAKVIGSPNAAVWPSVKHSKYFIILATRGIAINYPRKIDEYMKVIPYDAGDLLKQIFQWDPAKRITAKSALNSNWLVDVDMQPMMSSEFPDQDCHVFLLENPNNTPIEDIVIGNDLLPEPVTENPQLTNEYAPILDSLRTSAPIHVTDIATATMSQDQGLGLDGMGEEIKDEDLMKFVDSLSGRILELGDVLDRMRAEPVCSPDIVKGVIMRAARVWSETEPIRLRMVKFMLDYLLKPDEKDRLGF